MPKVFTIREICDIKYLRIVTHTHVASFFKKALSIKLTLFFDLEKSKAIQTKTIPFPESRLKIKVTLGRTLFLVLVTLVVSKLSYFNSFIF